MLYSSNKTKKPAFVPALYRSPVMAWVVLAISLTVTGVMYYKSIYTIDRYHHDQFVVVTDGIVDSVEKRLRWYEQLLRSGVGLFNASKYVDRDEWKIFVESMDINTHWPGIQGMGYAMPIKPEEREAHIAQVRAEGFLEYNIYPEGDRADYTSIIYLEPFDWRNQRAFGYDMFSNAMRREAMVRARDTGEPATSGIITLVQETDEDVQRGFLTYLPVYATKNTPETIVERRESFMGWVYAPYRAGDLMRSILGDEFSGVSFHVYDGRSISQDSLLYHSETDHRHDVEAGHERIVNITLQGRPWTIYFHTEKDDGIDKEYMMSSFWLVLGLLFDVLLFFAVRQIYIMRQWIPDSVKK